jgi:hypothetical protein
MMRTIGTGDGHPETVSLVDDDHRAQKTEDQFHRLPFG